MSFNNIKATVRKLADLPWPDFKNLFTWPCKSNLQADNPNLLVAKATNGDGEVVCYVAAESILLVDGYVFNPRCTPEESEMAGENFYIAFAQREGVSKMWMRIPDGTPPVKGEKLIRVIEENVPQPVTIQQRLEEKHSINAFIN